MDFNWVLVGHQRVLTVPLTTADKCMVQMCRSSLFKMVFQYIVSHSCCFRFFYWKPRASSPENDPAYRTLAKHNLAFKDCLENCSDSKGNYWKHLLSNLGMLAVTEPWWKPDEDLANEKVTLFYQIHRHKHLFSVNTWNGKHLLSFSLQLRKFQQLGPAFKSLKTKVTKTTFHSSWLYEHAFLAPPLLCITSS